MEPSLALKGLRREFYETNVRVNDVTMYGLDITAITAQMRRGAALGNKYKMPITLFHVRSI